MKISVFLSTEMLLDRLEALKEIMAACPESPLYPTWEQEADEISDHLLIHG